MRLDSTRTIASMLPGPGVNELTVISRLDAPLLRLGDEVEVSGLLYQLVARVWPASGVMGAVLRFRLIPQ